MSKTVYFVGMHNKPGKLPLDSNTKTGKIIDEIISGIKSNCVKTNLCEVEYHQIELVNQAEIDVKAKEWHYKYKPKDEDVIVLLGNWVKENFEWNFGKKLKNTVELFHPASFKVRGNKSQYVSDAIKLINNLL